MEAIELSLQSIENIEKDIKGEAISSPSELMQKLQAFAESLKLVAESGRGMNDVDLFPVPVELLHFMDSTTANPEVFRAQAYKKAQTEAEIVASRIQYLQHVGVVSEETLNTEISRRDDPK